MKATADLCDLFEDRVVVLAPLFRHFGGARQFHGPIVTVRVRDDNSMVRKQLETEGLGRVLFVDGHGSTKCALLGDQLAELAIRNGWAGVIVNGCIRDSAEIRNMPLGVMARATHPCKSQKRNSGETQVPVQIEGVELRPGQFLYADDDGIVISSEELLS
ncbi:MAG: ribonuclease E activity regulator RraA [Oligoflexus sp.]